MRCPISRYHQIPVDPAAIRLLIGRRRAELDSLGVRRLGLFGSTVRGESRGASDFDFLVEFDAAATFDRYMGLKLLLEDVLGRRVDLVTSKSLRPELRQYVERDLVQVA
jgi:uncharacterized protein